MRSLLLSLLLALSLSGCAGMGYWDDGRALTQMECTMQGGSLDECSSLPEYGFGDWEKWSEGLASGSAGTPHAPSGRLP
jgi:hypothetical protein